MEDGGGSLFIAHRLVISLPSEGTLNLVVGL